VGREAPVAFSLRPDQQKNVQTLASILREHGSSIDASDCGAGKTYVAAGLCKELQLTPLVIAPKATLPEWERVLRLAGIQPEACLSWEKARRHFKTWTHKPGRIFLFDEVHKAKNYRSLNSKMLIKAAKLNRVHMMSATAVMDPLDMKAIGSTLGIFEPSEFWHWCFKHGCRKGHFGGLVFSGDEKILNQIHARIFPARGVRTRREEIPGFPECSIEIHEMDLGTKVSTAYKKFAKEAGVRVSELFGDVEDEDHPLTKNLRLRQAVEIAKAPALIELVKDLEEDGVAPVLFLNFRETIEMVSKAIPNCAVIQGGNDNTAEMERFQTGKTNTAVVSITAGGTGISLHDINGTRPRVGILCPTDDPRAAEQAEGRIYRAGAKSKARLIKLFAAGTVEAQIATREREKRSKINIINNGYCAEPSVTVTSTRSPEKVAGPARSSGEKNEKAEMKNEKKRSKFPPSSLEMFELSPCFQPDQFQSTPQTESGDRIHHAAETGDLSGLADEEERQCAELCLQYANRIPGKHFVEHTLDILPGTRGRADLLAVRGSTAHLVDWKTGLHKQTPAEQNFQQQAYTLAIFKKFPDIQQITVHLVYVRLGVVSQHTYTRDNLPAIQKRLDDCVKTASKYQKTGQRKVSIACRNCALRAECTALSAEATSIAAQYKTDLAIPTDAIHPSQVTDPAVMGRLKQVATVLKEWIKSVDHRALEMALEDNICPDGYELRHRAGKRELKDAAATYAAVMDVLPAEEFMQACSVSMAKLEKLYGSKAKRGHKQEARRQLSERLADLGIINAGKDTPYLARVSSK